MIKKLNLNLMDAYAALSKCIICKAQILQVLIMSVISLRYHSVVPCKNQVDTARYGLMLTVSALLY